MTLLSESVISGMKNLWGYCFLSKCLKINLDSKNSEKSWEKFFFSWDNSLWIGIVKLPLLKKDTFYRQSICYQTVPTFCVWIKEIFSNSTDFAGINEYDKSILMQISTEPGHVYHVPCRGSSETGIFRHLSDHVFGVRNLKNTKSMRLIFFFKSLKLKLDFKNAEKNSEKAFCCWEKCIWIVIVSINNRILLHWKQIC